jgi:hypothetical protein
MSYGRDIVFTAYDRNSFINYGIMQSEIDYPDPEEIEFSDLEFRYNQFTNEEIYKWHKNYDLSRDSEYTELEIKQLSKIPLRQIINKIMSDISTWNEKSEMKIQGEVDYID